MITQTILILILFFYLIAMMSAIGVLIIPIEKVGIPLFWNDVKWTWFVYRNMKKAKIIDKEHLIYNGKVIVFYDSWLWNVYVGNSREEIRNKYSIGGQSNKACYLTWWQKIIGKKIEDWYLVNVRGSESNDKVTEIGQKFIVNLATQTMRDSKIWKEGKVYTCTNIVKFDYLDSEIYVDDNWISDSFTTVV